MTSRFVQEIRKAKVQADVIPEYAHKLQEYRTQYVDWPFINQAIITRWSMTGLMKIKKAAWERVDAR